MRENLNSEIIDRIIYHLGLALRDNETTEPKVEIEVDGLQSRFNNNYISITFANVVCSDVTIHIHITDLPEQHQEFLKKALAMWFVNVDGGYLVETEEVIEA